MIPEQQVPSTPVDPAKVRASLARLMEIYRGIAEKADEVSTRRCPYKNARSRCTAVFKCRNQYFTRVPGDLPVCTGSDKLDYRKAWETEERLGPA
ncbi:MAG: hypothetical protein HYY34_02450 [Chloroflexi bacterium]|nr:hypothetical protein [Chloroflexota bacterium]